jgi:hypothetical protein
MFCLPVVSASMSVVLRGAKKLRVHTAFGGSLTAADVGTVLVDFLADCEVPLELCLLHFFTFWKSLSWTICSDEILFTASLVFPVQSRPSVQPVVPCTCRKER